MDVAGNALNVVLAYPPSRQAVPAHQDKRVGYKSNNMCVPGGVELDAASGEDAMKGWRVRMPLARATRRGDVLGMGLGTWDMQRGTRSGDPARVDHLVSWATDGRLETRGGIGTTWHCVE